MTDFHFLRPWWLLTFIPLLLLVWCVLRRPSILHAWERVCDKHLLNHLVTSNRQSKRTRALLFIAMSVIWMIIAMAGPTWSRLPVPTYKTIQPRVVILDMSKRMLANDLSPSRLTRAKFKLHDLFSKKDSGQLGFIVYTGEPFIVSPLTDDAQTIKALLNNLTPDIMPVMGNRLDLALKEAGTLIKQAGYSYGNVLVLTSEPPSSTSIKEARVLSTDRIRTSIIPVIKNSTNKNIFYAFATAGDGEVITFSNTASDINQWLANTKGRQIFKAQVNNDIPVWRDQGRWFLIPALLFLLPAFRRGWLNRVMS